MHWGIYIVDPGRTRAGSAPLPRLAAPLTDPAAASLNADARTPVYLTADGPLGRGRVHGVFRAPGDDLWVAIEDDLNRITEAGLERLDRRHGLGFPVRTVMEDRDGNVWVGSRGAGLSRIATRGFSSFGPTEGLIGREVAALVQDRTSQLCLSGVTADGARWFGVLDGHTFRSTKPGGTDAIRYWGWGQALLQDRDGEWWIPTGEGLYRYPSTPACGDLARLRPKAVYRRGAGLSADDVFRVFEDSRGDVWIPVFGDPALFRWARATGCSDRGSPEGGTAV